MFEVACVIASHSKEFGNDSEAAYRYFSAYRLSSIALWHGKHLIDFKQGRIRSGSDLEKYLKDAGLKNIYELNQTLVKHKKAG